MKGLEASVLVHQCWKANQSCLWDDIIEGKQNPPLAFIMEDGEAGGNAGPSNTKAS